MRISMWVPYDEKRLRQTLRFLLRSQLTILRVMGAVMIVIGLALVALEPSMPIPYGVVVLGLLIAVAVAPTTVALSMRAQSTIIRDGVHLTLDNEWVTVAYPLAESRFRWVGVSRVIESPDVWYIMFGKIQAVTIPKDSMTEEQRAEFTAFVHGLRPAGK